LEHERSFWAPGRVNLIGEHTDYSDGLVCPAAIDLGITVTGRRADDITLQSSLDGERVVIAADGSTVQQPAGWGRYVAAVAQELNLLGRPAAGFAGTVTSTLPSGAGLSSSAALEVAVAIALCAVSEFELAPLELAAACRRAEFRAVGVPCGIMDQAASLLGAEGCAIFLDCGTLEHETVLFPDDLSLVIVDSGVRHEHEFSGYADRRRELEEAMVVLGGTRPADVSVEEAENLAREGDLDDLHWRRLRHVVSENERVRELVSALRDPLVDRRKLGELFLAGHASLRDDYEASTAELDRLVELAFDHGATAARMTGGGFGGSMLALVERDAAHDFGETVAAAYQRTAGEAPAVRICTATGAAREVT
jgi:galactokinase